MARVFFSAFNPILDTSNNTIPRFLRDHIIFTGIVLITQIAVVDANRSPYSVRFPFRVSKQNIHRLLPVTLNYLHLFLRACQQRFLPSNASYPSNVVQTPTIVQRLHYEKRAFDIIYNILCEHTAPQLSVVFVVTARNGSTSLFV